MSLTSLAVKWMVMESMKTPIPTDHKGVQQFLGFIEYLARFLPNISAYTGPFQTICTNYPPYFWIPLHQKCFNKIKNLAAKMPILKLIVWDIPTGLSEEEKVQYQVWVVTDACPAGMGVLLA